MLKIRRDDQIIVIAGRDKGKQGKVLKVLADSTLIVSGVNVVKKHTRPNPQLGVAGGILEKEAPISASNVAIYNSETQRADRVGFRINPDGSKVRFFKSNSKPIDL